MPPADKTSRSVDSLGSSSTEGHWNQLRSSVHRPGQHSELDLAIRSTASAYNVHGSRHGVQPLEERKWTMQSNRQAMVGLERPLRPTVG